MKMTPFIKITSLLYSILLCAASFASEIKTGEMAPNFTLKSHNGSNLRLSEQRGKVVTINFWGSRCGTCRQQLKQLQAQHETFTNDDMKIWAITLDDKKSDTDKTINKLNLTLPMLYDQNVIISKLYDIDELPTTVIINRDGKIGFIHKGYNVQDGRMLEQKTIQIASE